MAVTTIWHFNSVSGSAAPIIDGPRYLKKHHAAAQHMANQPVISEQWALIYSVVLVVIVALLIWMAIANFLFNRYRFGRLLYQWQNSFACRDCGTAFAAPDAGTTALTRS